jgi:hypothetical protein
MSDDYWQQEALRRVSGDPELDHQMQAELRAEQMQYYRNANTPPFQGFGGVQGLKEAATGVVILFVLGFIFKYVLGVG